MPVTTPFGEQHRLMTLWLNVLRVDFHLPHRVAKWLCIRNIPEDRIAAWLRPESSEWLSSGLWIWSAAVNRLLAAAEAGERVCIVGDYDVRWCHRERDSRNDSGSPGHHLALLDPSIAWRMGTVCRNGWWTRPTHWAAPCS